MSAAPEFSRRVPLGRIGAEPVRREITASAAERTALAGRFGLVALDRLSASVELVRQGRNLVLLRAAFEGEFVQSCVVTLEPVAGAIAERFSLLYGPSEAEDEATGAIAAADGAFEPFVGDGIDIGEAVAQEFSLALPPFPRRPDAGFAAEEPQNDGPFAGLARRLVRRDR